MITVEYGVIAKGVKEGLVPQALNFADISKVDDLTKDDLIFKKFGNPCEPYSVLLDGKSAPIPGDTSSENIGVWSLYVCDPLGVFDIALPTLTLTSDALLDTEGLTLTFDTQNNVFPTLFAISWYNGDALISSKEYAPTSAVFSIGEDVNGFNKIVMVFSKMNTPSSRLKLQSIQYGTISIIEEKTIKNMRVHQFVDPISTTIPTSTLDLSFLNTDQKNYNFAKREILRIINNGVLIGKYFIENAHQTSKLQWNIKAQDYINILESVEFEGGIYNQELALNILTNIFNKAKVPFTLNDTFLRMITLSGYIPYTTCRKALQQVLFAIGSYARTAYSEGVDILEYNTDPQEKIALDRILMGQSVSIDASITELELVAHSYTPIADEVILHEANETEKNLKIIFNEPTHDLTIENGEILESGNNYAIVNCQVGAILKGKKYKHTTFSKIINETVDGKSGNKKTIKNATLISWSNVDKILNVCYNYITRNIAVKSKIIESETPFVVGDAYSIETELFGTVTGIISEQSFSLYGGKKVVKEAIIK